MAAFTPNDFPIPVAEQDSSFQNEPKFDVHPNFNGPQGVVRQNFTITSVNELSTGMLFTASYAEAALNTITVQFTAPTVSASTTAADWTLSGPGGTPTITSVTYKAGSRSVLLNLSGALSSVNTYTLSIAANKVLSGWQATLPNDGVYNWPSLVVDVILPAEIDTIGVGIAQNIVLGTPNVDTAGAAVGTGFVQTIDLGTPVVNTLLSTTGVGFNVITDVGTPSDTANAQVPMVGIAQAIALGTPAATLELEPVGVGISQSIVLGTPVADINPLTPTGVGINETIFVGTSPVISAAGNVTGQGLPQIVAIGTPLMSQPTSFFTGVGINQPIDLGTPLIGQPAAMVGIQQDIVFGAGPSVGTIVCHGLGIEQDIVFGTPIADNSTNYNVFGGDIEQDIVLGTPTVARQFFGLIVTPQQANLIDLFDPLIQAAFAYGVQGAVNPNLIDEIPQYLSLLSVDYQGKAKTPFKAAFASFIYTVNFKEAWPTTHDTDSTTVSTSTTDKTLAFVDGMLVSVT